jgi:hypothetical protein
LALRAFVKWATMRLVRIALAAAAALALAAAGCSSGHGGVKPDPDTSIDVTGAIGGVRALERRSAAERLLGRGEVVSRVTRHPKEGAYTLIRVRYQASQLLVVYVARPGRSARVAEIFTASPRYRTSDGLRVGSTLARARRERGITCYQQTGYLACQGGLGYEHPVTSFTVRGGRVIRVLMAARAD